VHTKETGIAAAVPVDVNIGSGEQSLDECHDGPCSGLQPAKDVVHSGGGLNGLSDQEEQHERDDADYEDLLDVG
jgi:hypothetical protein